MERALFYLNLFFFSLVWLGATAYTFFAILNPQLTYSLSTFWFFIILLDVLAFPLIWFWWHLGPKTISHKTWIMSVTILAILWWGFFTLYSFLLIHMNDLQFRWVAFAYIWEVIVVGGVGAYAVVRIARFAELFLNNEVTAPPDAAHARIVAIPWHAALTFAGIIIFGYSVGSLQLAYFSELPFPEIVKNMLTGMVSGIFGSLLIFFILERIINPALRKSGASIELTRAVKAKKRLSLFTKIYVTTGILALMSVSFFGMMAYSRGQIIFEEQLRFRLQRELEFAREQFRATGMLLSDAVKKERFGQHGELRLEIAEKGSTAVSSITIDRARTAKLIGVLPLDEMRYLRGIIFEYDFNAGLSILLIFSMLMFFMILLLVSVINTFFVRSITGPIEEIKAGGIRMGKGSFSQPISIYTNDELEDVSAALNEAARKLEASYSNLETEISLRTKEVAEANKILQRQIVELDKTSKQLVQRDFALQQANERYRELDEAKSQFVSIAAHQLRTPLSAIKWALHMLLSGDAGKVSAKQQPLIAQSLESAERIITLVGDLLNIARIESGQVIYRFEPFNPEALVNVLINEASPKAKEKRISLSFVCKTKPFPEAAGDWEKLTMALQGILENAINYTEINGNVAVSLEEKDDKYYQISVSDNGMGIPESQQRMIFQKFFRGDNVIKKQIEGTGLALYITSKIIKAHGGSIEVRSVENKGTTFVVTLPFLR